MKNQGHGVNNKERHINQYQYGDNHHNLQDKHSDTNMYDKWMVFLF